MTQISLDDMHPMSIASKILRSEDAAEIDAIFEKVRTLDAGLQQKIVDNLEPRAIDYAKLEGRNFRLFGRFIMAMDVLASFTASPRERAEMAKDEAEMLAAEHALIQTFLHIAKIKADKADPITKTIAREYAALSKEHRGSSMRLASVFAKACKKPSKNPLRKLFSRNKKPKGPGQ